jgi:DDE superfamily endonuclease
VGTTTAAAPLSGEEAGPYQTVPYPGPAWDPQGQPTRQDHEYSRESTAKLLTLFCPASGQVRVKGVRSCTNAVLHPWLKTELTAILAALPATNVPLDATANRATWERWQDGVSTKTTLSTTLPPLRLLVVLDNLAVHTTPEFVVWCFQHGILLLYTPLGGSWLNMAGSIQRILVCRALTGHHPQSPDEIIDWLEAVAVGWNRNPTPFVWGGKRRVRRVRARERRHALGGSGAWARQPIRRRKSRFEQWLLS